MCSILALALSVSLGASPYDDAVAQSLRENKPLVVVPRQAKIQKIESFGMIVYRGDFDGETGIFVGIPLDGEMVRIQQDLPSTATADDVRNLIRRWEAGRSANPFSDRVSFLSSERLFDRLPTADDKDRPASWPKGVPFLRGMRAFVRARFTQEIATTNNAPRITPMPRDVVASKWHQSGGMEGISKDLWRSDVFKLVPDDEEYVFTGPVGVLNGYNSIQYEQGWQGDFPSGTVFVDMLSNRESGKVFELRVREKEGGRWRSFVAFRDKAERPAGYAGLQNVQCASCHNHIDGPGTGPYAGPLVPGRDTVVSAAFPRLEAEGEVMYALYTRRPQVQLSQPFQQPDFSPRRSVVPRLFGRR
jgi:hypothetical protein